MQVVGRDHSHRPKFDQEQIPKLRRDTLCELKFAIGHLNDANSRKSGGVVAAAQTAQSHIVARTTVNAIAKGKTQTIDSKSIFPTKLRPRN